ncbi:MAG TPA: ABC transporter permease [Pseudolabrys sp.]
MSEQSIGVAAPLAAAPKPAPKSKPHDNRLYETYLPRLVAGVVILLAWEFIVRALAPAYVAKPSSVLLAFPRVIADPTFLKATGATLAAVAQGLGITLVFGTVIGVLMGRSDNFDRAIRHYINGFNAIPMIVVLPLFSLWFGYSSNTRIATIIFAAIFSIIMNVADGARSVPREYLEVARSFRASRLTVLFGLVLPASMPYLLAGIRLAAGRALVGAVVAEFFLSIGGLGYYILLNSRTYHHNEAFVGVLLLAAFGVGFELLVNGATRRFMPWYRREDKTN